MRTRFKIFATVSLLMVSAVPPAPAQNSAEITGSASDNSGAMIAGVAIIMTNRATNQTRKVNTNAAGIYGAPYLVPGVHDVTAESPGLFFVEVWTEIETILRKNSPTGE